MQLYIRVYRRNRLVAHFPLTDLKPTKQLSLLESWRASELSKESAAYRAWKKRDWKTAEGKPVVHKAILEEILKELEGVPHQFVHVRAHTGGEDTDSKWNDYADQLATKAAELSRPVKFEELVEKVIRTGTTADEVLSGIPLKIMGAPMSESDLVKAILANTASLDQKFLGTALIAALKKTMNARAYDLEKTKIHGAAAYRLIEKTHLTIEKLDS